MTSSSEPTTISTSLISSLKRERRTVVLIDLVESVRHFEKDDITQVARWKAFISGAVSHIHSAKGEVVRSTGDGILAMFNDPGSAAKAVFKIRENGIEANASVPDSQKLFIRVSGNATSLFSDDDDIYGNGINVAARLLELAQPDEFIVTESFRAALTDGLDAKITDLGECRLRNLSEPVRAYRIGEANALTRFDPVGNSIDQSRPSIAVLPFQHLTDTAEFGLLGDALADDLIARFSQSSHLVVVARLSSSIPALKALEAEPTGAILQAEYLVSGTIQLTQTRVRVRAKLVRAKSNEVLWADSVTVNTGDLFDQQDAVSSTIAQSVSKAILEYQLELARVRPIQSVDTYSLELGAIDQMHRQSLREFDRSRQIMQYLIEREPRNPDIRAWLAKWHVLRVVQGWAVDGESDSQLAMALCEEALSLNSKNSLALSISGLVSAYLNHDMAAARSKYDQAILTNPNESLAWLFSSTLHSYTNQGARAEEAAEFSYRLSPIDPLRYYYQSLAATAVLSNNNYSRAIALCQESLRAHRTHASTYKTLAIAQALSGDVDSARTTVNQLEAIAPDFTVSRFLAQYPGREATHAQSYAEALLAAGAKH